MVRRLVEHAGDALARLGDYDTVEDLLEVVAVRGTGAERQRTAWNRAESPAALVAVTAPLSTPVGAGGGRRREP